MDLAKDFGYFEYGRAQSSEGLKRTSNNVLASKWSSNTKFRPRNYISSQNSIEELSESADLS